MIFPLHYDTLTALRHIHFTIEPPSTSLYVWYANTLSVSKTIASVKNEWISMEHWWTVLTNQTEIMKENFVLAPLCALPTTTKSAVDGLGLNRGLLGNRPATNSKSRHYISTFHVSHNQRPCVLVEEKVEFLDINNFLAVSSLHVKTEHTLKVFWITLKNTMLSRTQDLQQRLQQEDGENYIMRNFIIIIHLIIAGTMRLKKRLKQHKP